ncbi:MAG: hypothetical protein U0169_12475 [Polyangiaceae bacterium]
MTVRVAPAIAFAVASAACGPRVADVAPPSEGRTIALPETDGPLPRSPVGGAPETKGDGYEHVARRPLVTVGLAESRGLDRTAATALVERLADVADTCLTNLGAEGHLGDGALRIVVEWNEDGSLAGADRKFSPGGGSLATGLLCLVHPVQSIVLAPRAKGDGGVSSRRRGVAIEATWGRPSMAPGSPSTMDADAGKTR